MPIPTRCAPWGAAALFTLLLLPAEGAAQSILAIPRPRAQIVERLANDTRALAPAAQAKARVNAVRTDRSWWDWDLIADEVQGAEFWASQKVALLPGSSLSLGSDKAALYSEMAAVHSGAWRFAVGTTLAVATDGEEDDAGEDGNGDGGAAQVGEEAETPSGFQKFVAGGGNLSLAALRPIGLRNGDYNSQLLFAIPRAWVNIPSLNDAADVNDYGGELALEYHYQRYARSLERTAAELDTTDAPFFTLQLRGGVVHGSSSFFRTIGRAEEKLFVYLAPTAQFIIQDKIKVGVTTFIGPRDFREHRGVRVNFAIVPERKAEEPEEAPAGS